MNDNAQQEIFDPELTLIDQAVLLGQEAVDYDQIEGITSLKGIFENATVKRAAWMTRRAEVAKAFEFYNLEAPGIARPQEVTMLGLIKSHLCPAVCPSCLDKTYDDTRWHKVTDRDEPIRIAMTKEFSGQFGSILDRAMLLWVRNTHKLEFELVNLSEQHDARLEFGDIDGRNNVLGYVSRIEEGDLAQTFVRLRMDKAERWSNTMMFWVLVHELGHLIGIGHTPREYAYIREVMFPIYYSIERSIQGWTEEQLHGKYGAPEVLT